MDKEQKIRDFSEEIWQWYASNKRTLPWRDMRIDDDTERAYRVLVSECMLQQTQVSRVETLFPVFLSRFPSVEALAAASNKDVILAWRGLGYNMRALRLRDACMMIRDVHGGVFPSDMPSLLGMKGIGHYTAAAVRNFAFDMPTPCVDVNIERIFLRVFYGPAVLSRPRREMLALAEEVLRIAVEPTRGRGTGDWHAALMDFGSLVCTKKNPRYDICPLMKRDLYAGAYKKEAIATRKKEPSRGDVPNRIFRGKVIELLRDAPRGMRFADMGALICKDWNAFPDDELWLEKLIAGLRRDELIMQRENGRYVLAS